MNFKTKLDKVIPPQYQYPILVVVFSVALEAVTFWQLEVVERELSEGWQIFNFPFFMLNVNIWIARDFFFLLDLLAYILLAWGMYQLGARNIKILKIITFEELEKKKYPNEKIPPYPYGAIGDCMPTLKKCKCGKLFWTVEYSRNVCGKCGEKND